MLLNSLFTSVLSPTTSAAIDINIFLLCLLVSLGIGLFVAILYTYKTKCTKSFVITLATLPSAVAMVIMMVNGNIGAGVAVAGAFSLVRFRSVPGTAKEIGAIFLAMGGGLAVGMGYLGFAILFTVILSLVSLLLNISAFGEPNKNQRILIITIPEDLNYTNIFDDLFSKYTKMTILNNVKTSNMGSLFKLSYEIELIDENKEKDFVDELRCRNGNLEIIIYRNSSLPNEL